jgi:hypothetical protein
MYLMESDMFKRKPSPPAEKRATKSGILRGESPYRQRLIDLCVEHNVPLEEVFYGDVLHCVSTGDGGWANTQWTTDIMGMTHDPYQVIYESLMKTYSKRVVKLV